MGIFVKFNIKNSLKNIGHKYLKTSVTWYVAPDCTENKYIFLCFSMHNDFFMF